MMKKFLNYILVCIMLVSCLSGVMMNARPVSAVSKKTPYISSKSIVMTKGKTTTLKVVNAKGKISWSTSKASVATVNAKGKVTAKKQGTAVITATVSKKQYKCTVTVASKKTKILVAYFSQTNTTRDAAKSISSITGGSLLRIQPRTAYTKNYDKLIEAAQKELEDNARPQMATKVNNMNQYDVIFIGYPIWWGEEPMIIRTFLEKYNLSGKTVIPFCTSGGSGISGSMENIRSIADGAEVLNGRDVTDDSRADIKRWIERLGIK